MDIIMKCCLETLTVGHLISVRRSKRRTSCWTETQLIEEGRFTFSYLPGDVELGKGRLHGCSRAIAIRHLLIDKDAGLVTSSLPALPCDAPSMAGLPGNTLISSAYD